MDYLELFNLHRTTATVLDFAIQNENLNCLRTCAYHCGLAYKYILMYSYQLATGLTLPSNTTVLYAYHELRNKTSVFTVQSDELIRLCDTWCSSCDNELDIDHSNITYILSQLQELYLECEWNFSYSQSDNAKQVASIFKYSWRQIEQYVEQNDLLDFDEDIWSEILWCYEEYGG